MHSAVDALIETLGGLLAGVSPLAKAVVPSAAALVTALVNMALTGSFDTTSIVVLACGVVTSLAVYLIPNLERRAKHSPTPAPMKPAPVVPPAPPAPKA